MDEVAFHWYRDVDREGAEYLLPVGDATVARMRFLPAVAVTPHRSMPARLVFGETIEVSDDFTRTITLDRETGNVAVARLDDPDASFVVNSTLDLFLSSLAVYGLWHTRLLAAGSHPRFESLVAAAQDHLVRLDPAAGSADVAWWPTRIEAVGRLV